MSAQTLYDKLWQSHVVHTEQDGTALLYIDRHLLHEVTSPQAFEGLRLAGRKPWRLSANLAVADHNVPTTDRSQGIADPISRLQVEKQRKPISMFAQQAAQTLAAWHVANEQVRRIEFEAMSASRAKARQIVHEANA